MSALPKSAISHIQFEATSIAVCEMSSNLFKRRQLSPVHDDSIMSLGKHRPDGGYLREIKHCHKIADPGRNLP